MLFGHVLVVCTGLCAEEIHICGEPAAINFVKELMYTTGEEVEVSPGYPTICYVTQNVIYLQLYKWCHFS